MISRISAFEISFPECLYLTDINCLKCMSESFRFMFRFQMIHQFRLVRRTLHFFDSVERTNAAARVSIRDFFSFIPTSQTVI